MTIALIFVLWQAEFSQESFEVRRYQAQLLAPDDILALELEGADITIDVENVEEYGFLVVIDVSDDRIRVDLDDRLSIIEVAPGTYYFLDHRKKEALMLLAWEADAHPKHLYGQIFTSAVCPVWPEAYGTRSSLDLLRRHVAIQQQVDPNEDGHLNKVVGLDLPDDLSLYRYIHEEHAEDVSIEETYFFLDGQLDLHNIMWSRTESSANIEKTWIIMFHSGENKSAPIVPGYVARRVGIDRYDVPYEYTKYFHSFDEELNESAVTGGTQVAYTFIREFTARFKIHIAFPE